MPTLGEQLITALAAGPLDDAGDLLAEDIWFRGLTPPALRDGVGRDKVMAILAEWFPPGDVDKILSLESGAIGDRHRVGYRIRWRSPDGASLQFEQQAYYDVGPDGITWLSLVCSGDVSA